MNNYYDDKIKILYNKYIELFKNMILQKQDTNIDNNVFITPLAFKVKQYYPELETQIDRIIYIFTEDENSEEKLDSLLDLYKVISEEIYGKTSC